ncbi:MAG TPA: bifunctional folylpolyglutamate synthase/dihydrofolate synthase [Rhodospirillaceae bacterium]|nr:bifunctional folylpolyglutamate synthase/dihydrofolate synthase [Rhodospirillaceae bacterium]
MNNVSDNGADSGSGQESDAILERLHALHPKLIDLSLGRIEALMSRLGSPEKNLPPVIHIAGTNGKGSTLAFLRAMLEAASLRVHAYTSPHLVRFAERIMLAGNTVKEEDLVKLLSECERANGGEEITFFEITTAAAFLAFANVAAEIVLLETGLGGRLDATNLVAKPALTVITPIAMDHMQYLGDSLSEIAGEKAAIQKPGVTSVVGPQDEVAQAVILAVAEDVGAEVFLYGRDWRIDITDDGFAYSSEALELDLPRPSLPGAHQLINAATAIACLEQLTDFELSDRAIVRGLSNTDWPGRLQNLTEGNLAEALPSGWELWLDGGHNAAAGQALGSALSVWSDKPTHLVLGMLQSKQALEFLKPLASVAESAQTIEIPGEKSTAAAHGLAATAAEAGLRASPAADLRSAIGAIMAEEPGPARILICGSLYLLGHVYRVNGAGGPA